MVHASVSLTDLAQTVKVLPWTGLADQSRRAIAFPAGNPANSLLNWRMAEEFDCIILGLGAMGSAAAYHLSRQGSRVLGMDRFHPPHNHGSSHGLTRIIREAYFEHPLYVPLVQRAYELWASLERDSRRTLFRQTGGLMIGRPDGALVQGALRSARQHRLSHEVFTATEARRRHPALRLEMAMVAVREPRAGILFPELAVQSHPLLAKTGGATVPLMT